VRKNCHAKIEITDVTLMDIAPNQAPENDVPVE
jgi:hypothetical protein